MLASEVISPPSDLPNPWANPEHSPTMPARKTAATKSTASKRKTPTAKKAKTTKQAASPKSRTASSKAKTKAKAKTKTKAKTKAGDKEVTIDRRTKADRRDETPETVVAPTEQPQQEKREKVQRRRQIDPTTCERDYSDPEVQFMSAMDEYKRTSGRMFPTCSEVLEVIRDLGYVQLTPAELATVRPEVAKEATDSEDVQVDIDEAEQEMAEMTC